MEEQKQVQKIEPVSIGEWVLTFILTAIPVVGLILLCVWAFGENKKPSKANWAKAVLILMAISLIVVFLFLNVIGATLHSLV